MAKAHGSVSLSTFRVYTCISSASRHLNVIRTTSVARNNESNFFHLSKKEKKENTWNKRIQYCRRDFHSSYSNPNTLPAIIQSKMKKKSKKNSVQYICYFVLIDTSVKTLIIAARSRKVYDRSTKKKNIKNGTKHSHRKASEMNNSSICQ